jgi:polyhydroxyalkanoate synthase subunit PhaC
MPTTSHQPQSPEVPPERLGPRPYMQHLATATGAWTSSLAALPLLKNGSLPWSPSLQNDRDALLASLARIDPREFAAAVVGEVAARRARFEAGVGSYRTHPYCREMPEVPVLWQAGTTRLLDYRSNAVDATLPAVLVVPSLVNRYYVLDLMPDTSFLRWLAGKGFPVFAIDWDAPGAGELGFDLTAYTTERLEPVLDAVRAATRNTKPVVIGYCMGGNLALALAHRRATDLAGLALLATPWDFHAERPEQARWLGAMAGWLMPAMAASGALPVDAIQSLFAALDPMQVIRKFLAFAALDPASDRARRFVALEDWLNDGIPLASPVAIETLAGWYGANAPATGQWRVGGSVVDPAACRLPALVLIPGTDRIVPPGSARALAAALPMAETMTPAAGHIGMMVGGRAERDVWQPIAAWLRTAG